MEALILMEYVDKRGAVRLRRLHRETEIIGFNVVQFRYQYRWHKARFENNLRRVIEDPSCKWETGWDEGIYTDPARDGVPESVLICRLDGSANMTPAYGQNTEYRGPAAAARIAADQAEGLHLYKQEKCATCSRTTAHNCHYCKKPACNHCAWINKQLFRECPDCHDTPMTGFPLDENPEADQARAEAEARAAAEDQAAAEMAGVPGQQWEDQAEDQAREIAQDQADQNTAAAAARRDTLRNRTREIIGFHPATLDLVIQAWYGKLLDSPLSSNVRAVWTQLQHSADLAALIRSRHRWDQIFILNMRQHPAEEYWFVNALAWSEVLYELIQECDATARRRDLYPDAYGQEEAEA